MTTITREDVERVARLARLKLTGAEQEAFTAQLNSILEYIQKIDQLDLEEVVPTAHVLPLSNVYREDETAPGLPQDAALQNAPEQEQGMFRVPKIG